MEIDQSAVTVRLAQAFEVVLFNTAAAFVLGNCLNDLRGVRGHATTKLIQGQPNNLTECPHLINQIPPPPHSHTHKYPTNQHFIQCLYKPILEEGGLLCVCCLNEWLRCVKAFYTHAKPPHRLFSGH